MKNNFNDRIINIKKDFISDSDINIILSMLVNDSKKSSLLSFDFKKVGESLKQSVKDTTNNIGNMFMDVQNKQITSDNFEKFRLDINQGIGSIYLAMQGQLTWFDYDTNNSIKSVMKSLKTKLKMDEICKATLFYYYSNNPNFKDLVDRAKKEISTSGFEKMSENNLTTIYNTFKVIAKEMVNGISDRKVANKPSDSSVKDTRNSNEDGDSKNNSNLSVKVESNTSAAHFDIIYNLFLKEYWDGSKGIDKIDLQSQLDEISKSDKKTSKNESEISKLREYVEDILKKSNNTNIRKNIEYLLSINSASDQLIRLFFNDYNSKNFKYLLPNLKGYSMTNLARLNDKFKKTFPYSFDEVNEGTKGIFKKTELIYNAEQNLIDLYNKSVSDRSNETKFLDIVFNACTNNDNSPKTIADRLIADIKSNPNGDKDTSNYTKTYILVCKDISKKEGQPYDSHMAIKQGSSFINKEAPKDLPSLYNIKDGIIFENKSTGGDSGVITISIEEDNLSYIFYFGTTKSDVRKYISVEDFYNHIYMCSGDYKTLENNIKNNINKGTTPTPASGTTPTPASGTTPTPASGTTPTPASGTTPTP